MATIIALAMFAPAGAAPPDCDVNPTHPSCDHGGGGFIPVTLCHATPTGAGGSGPAKKYELITVNNQGQLNGHLNHPNDIIPAESCPTPPGDGDNGNGNGHEGNGSSVPAEVPGCNIEVQAYAGATSQTRYIAVAYSPKPPNEVLQSDEGEVFSLYVVNRGVAVNIQPAGHQTPFVAIRQDAGDADGNAYVTKCSGSVMLNLYDVNGIYRGHPQLRWDGNIAKGFNALNSGLLNSLDFLDLGILP